MPCGHWFRVRGSFYRVYGFGNGHSLKEFKNLGGMVELSTPRPNG
tara:strand:+ start:422 stop:556 length:135 start_codon:yes stop_codon:yes gene_type:complete